MPAFEVMDMQQDAVLWRKTGSTEYNVTIVSAAESLKVRWVNKRREIVDSKGNTIATDAQVVSCEDIPIGSIMWEGCYDDLSSGTGSTPVPTGNLMIVVTHDRASDIKNRVTRRTYNLMRYQDVIQVQ